MVTKAIEGAFGADVDYAQLVKLYRAAPESAKGRYSPVECTGSNKTNANVSLTSSMFKLAMLNVKI